MVDILTQLVADGIIEAVVARLKSGKEADIYLVQHAGEIVAAKVYKERNARNFRNNAAYKEGRQVRNSRTQRAMARGSRFGQAASEEAWKAKEAEALHSLHAAGVRVPQPVMFYEGVLLMEAVIDAEGHPAPRLIDAAISPERAGEYYADLRQQAVKMLTCDLIHGDLSPYNVLMAWNGPTLIDFPQVVGAAHNSQAEFFFLRDLQALHRFFTSIEPSLGQHGGDGREIWQAYQRRHLTADFVPTGKLSAPPRPNAAHNGHRHKQGGQDRSRKAHSPRPVGPPPRPAPDRKGGVERKTSAPVVSYLGRSTEQAGTSSPKPSPRRHRRRRRPQ
jgi:RIO kinase 1